MKHVLTSALAVTAFAAFMSWAFVSAIPAIHAWEKANDYPYGKLCELYRTCK